MQPQRAYARSRGDIQYNTFIQLHPHKFLELLLKEADCVTGLISNLTYMTTDAKHKLYVKFIYYFRATLGVKEVTYCNRQNFRLRFLDDFSFYITPTVQKCVLEKMSMCVCVCVSVCLCDRRRT